MKTVILCGGKGTRIRDVSDQLPKPMIPVGPYPILWHIMRGYAAAGFKDFVLCLGHKGSEIKNFFLNYREMTTSFSIDFADAGKLCFEDDQPIDWKVTLAETGEDTMTGSRIQSIKRFIGDDEEFLLTYGDGVSDVPVAKVLEHHRAHGRVMTVCGVRPPGRFGEIDCDDSGRVFEFNEKPQATGGRISGGFFVCNRKLFDYLDPTRSDQMLEAEPMRRLAADGLMGMYPHDGFWQCMDTYRDYALLNELWAGGKAPWRTW